MLAVGLQCMACVGVFKPLLGVNVSIHMFFFIFYQMLIIGASFK
jgi:hypothetical protein